MNSLPAPERLHALDALRASALLLGVLLHAAMAYMQESVGWAVRDASTSLGFSVFVLVVHSFRLELFFLLAGFFGRLMHQRLGGAGLLANRAKRILLPLALGWFAVYPGLCFAWIWGLNPNGAPPPAIVGWGATLATLPKLFSPAHDFPLGHLWFLYYLAMSYAAFLGVRWLLARWPQGQRRVAQLGDAVVRAAFGRALGALLLAFLSWPLLLTMKTLGVDTPDKTVIPQFAPLLLYLGCFAFGWALHRQRAVLEPIAFRWRGLIATALAASLLTLAVAGPAMANTGPARAAFQFFYAAMMWGWVFASFALFLRFRQQESAVWRYLADASYWVYLIHLPIVAALQVALSRMPQNCWVKFGAVSLAGLALSLASYHLFVRSTPIGRLLNGRRHPFWPLRARAVTA